MVYCRKDKAAVLFTVVARLLLELCRNDPEFCVTKRKGGGGEGILPVELCFISC